MAFSKKTWKNRVSEQPQRRLLTPTDGGSSYTVDVTRQEGIVVEEGDAFSAQNMNDLETRIKNTFDADEATLSAVNTKANTNATNITSLQSNMTNLSCRVSTNASNITSLSNRMTTAEGKVTTLQSNVTSLQNDKAPTNHASSSTIYGKGSTSNFGHLKIADDYQASAGSAADGVAASSQAVANGVIHAYTSALNTLNPEINSLKTRMTTAESNINKLKAYSASNLDGQLLSNIVTVTTPNATSWLHMFKVGPVVMLTFWLEFKVTTAAYTEQRVTNANILPAPYVYANDYDIPVGVAKIDDTYASHFVKVTNGALYILPREIAIAPGQQVFGSVMYITSM